MTLKRFTTAEAAPEELRAIRALMSRAFDGDFTDDDWSHSVGGWHVVAMDAGAIVAHASVVRRSLEVGDARFDAGYVEAVATEPDWQGLGFGTDVMTGVADVIAAHHHMGALSTGEHHFYERLGWERWLGPTYVKDGRQLIRTSDEDDGIMVLRVGASTAIALTDPIVCQARSGDDW